MCRACLADLGSSRPRMPKNALANDNWIGREPMVVRTASQGTVAELSWEGVLEAGAAGPRLAEHAAEGS